MCIGLPIYFPVCIFFFAVAGKLESAETKRHRIEGGGGGGSGGMCNFYLDLYFTGLLILKDFVNPLKEVVRCWIFWGIGVGGRWVKERSPPVR
jgi:hypothetical protein